MIQKSMSRVELVSEIHTAAQSGVDCTVTLRTGQVVTGMVSLPPSGRTRYVRVVGERRDERYVFPADLIDQVEINDGYPYDQE